MVLRTRRQGETNKLVTLFTEDHGKLRVMANGARRPKSRFAGCLEVGWSVRIACSLRDDRDLHTLAEAELIRSRPALVADLRRLSYGAAACEVVDRLTIEHEPGRRLFRCLTGVLGGLEEVRETQLEALFWYYQLRVAEALGYRPELGACVLCGSPAKGDSAWFSAALGGGLCGRCSRSDEGGPGEFGGPRRVASDSLRLLEALQGLPAYSREAIPQAPPALTGEIRSLLRGFLEYHGGTKGRLRSLEFLDTLTKDEADG